MIPDALARRPQHDGYPITYVTAIIGGVPDFTTLDDGRFVECLTDGLCGMCGRPLDWWSAVVGSPEELGRRTFRDPPMHVDCAEYAASVCPFLAGKMRYRPVTTKPPADRVSAPEMSRSGRPDIILLGEFRTYRWGMSGGRPMVRTSPLKRVREATGPTTEG